MITQGTWTRDDDEIGVEVTVGADLTFLTICTLQEPSLYHTTEAIGEKEDNANLILAATDLLKVAKLFEELTRKGQPAGSEDLEQLQQTIAKAEGR